MSIQPESSDIVEDASDDGQLTIRIPNPKVYMARQSQWVGRRGKPRCDHCRTGNLKCDRVLPMCNHCSWANQAECSYTPMPTPAHRGIPRCDRCRANNMKCDRNLPVCNNCERDAGGTACNYTPKKRHKLRTTEEDPSKASMKVGQSIMSQKSEKPPPLKTEPEKDVGSHTFYGHNVGVPGGIIISPSHSESESPSDVDPGQTGRFTADFAKGSHSFPAFPSGGTQRQQPIPAPLEFIPHAFPLPQERKSVINSSNVEPWVHQSFVSLPSFVCQRLRQLDIAEFPNRRDFDTSLLDFQNGMMDELRETTCLPADAYTNLARCLASGNLSTLSDRVQSWASIHKLCSGHEKYNLILVPRVPVFSQDSTTFDNHKRQFVADLLSAKSDLDSIKSGFDVMPVRQQIYDILTYAHLAHRPAIQMLSEVSRLRFAYITWPMAEMYVKMCPSCKLSEEEESYSSSSSP